MASYKQVNNLIINKSNKIKNVMNATLIGRIASAANNKHDKQMLRGQKDAEQY